MWQNLLNSLNTGFDNLAQNPNQALNLAVGIQGAVSGNSTPSNTALNNTATASGSLAKSGNSNIFIWIGAAVVGVILVVLLVKK